MTLKLHDPATLTAATPPLSAEPTEGLVPVLRIKTWGLGRLEWVTPPAAAQVVAPDRLATRNDLAIAGLAVPPGYADPA